jgi:ABC-type antimicrobial peptide transport system permease subunit
VPDATLAPRPYLEPGTAVVLAAVLVGVGIASGVWPARRASRIEPAISLRSL